MKIKFDDFILFENLDQWSFIVMYNNELEG